MSSADIAQQSMAGLSALNVLAQTLNRDLGLREVLDGALPHIIEVIGLHSGWIFLRDEAGAFRLAARHELPPAITYPGPAWSGECNCQELCLSGKLNKAVNMVRCSRLQHAVGDKRSLAQHASVPIHSDAEILGILNVATSEYGRFTPTQLQLLSAIGYMLGTAIMRIQLYEQIKVRRVQEQAALLELSYELLGAEALEPALQQLMRVGAQLLEADACAYVEADEEQGNATLLAAHGWHVLPQYGLPTVLDPTNPHLWYLPESSANLAADALDDLPPILAAQHFQGHLALTIKIGDVPVGTLMINTAAPRHFLMDEACLFGLLGNQVAALLKRSRTQRHKSHLCPNCGYRGAQGEHFCAHCGVAFEQIEQALQKEIVAVTADLYSIAGIPSSGITRALDRVLKSANSKQARVVRRCAIPRWYDLDVLALLREQVDGNERVMELLHAFSFVRQLDIYHYAYHEEIRAVLLAEWREQHPDELRAWNIRLAAHFEQRIATTQSDVQLALSNRSLLEHDLWRHEVLYHRLMADPKAGMVQLEAAFVQAELTHNWTEAETLVQIASDAAFDHDNQLPFGKLWERLERLRQHSSQTQSGTPGQVSKRNTDEAISPSLSSAAIPPSSTNVISSAQSSATNTYELTEAAGYELFRRAIVEYDEEAWAAISTHYRGLLITWARRASAGVSVDIQYEDIADHALARAWAALSPERFAQFPSLAALLAYLHMCVGSAVIDAARAEAMRERANQTLAPPSVATPEDVLSDAQSRDGLWQLINKLISSEHELIILIESLVLGRSARAIFEHHQDLFADVSAVYSVKRNLFNRIAQRRDLQQIYEQLRDVI